MKTALALIGVLVLSALVLFGLWSLLPAGSGAGAGRLDGAPAQALSSPDAAANDALAAAPVEGVEADGRRAEAAASAPATDESGEEAWPVAESLWLRGSVNTAGPGARDDLLVVYALERAADLSDLEAFLAPKDDEDEAEGDGEADEDEHEHEHASKPLLLSRRRVEPDGTFELPLPPGTRYAHLIALGRFFYMPSTRSFEIGSTTKIALNPQCGGSIEGRVEESGEPDASAREQTTELVLSAKLQGALTRAAGFRRTAVAQPDGSFAIHAVPAARAYTLDAETERFAPRRLDVSPLTPGETRPVHVLLSPGAKVRGRVIDEAGAPVPGAEVTGALKMVFAKNLGERKVDCDAEGAFTITALPPGDVTLQAQAEGYLESPAAVRTLVDGQEQSGIELVLESGESIAGTLQWPDGSPASDVEVKATYDPAQIFARGGLNAQRGGSSEARTDDAGRFVLRGLASSRFDLSASARPPGEVAQRFFATLEVDLSAPQPEPGDDPARPSRIFDADWMAREPSIKAGSEGLALVLHPPRGVAGRVVDDSGEPVKTFRVRAVQYVETSIGPMARDRQEKPFEDEGGRFYFSGLASGSYSFYALAEGFSSGEPAKLTLPDQEKEEHVLRIVRSASVSGTVYSPLGGPVGGALVGVDTGGPFWASEMSGAPKTPSTSSTGDGRFLLEDLAPGSVTLSVAAEGYASGSSEALELAPGQRLEGIDLYLSEGGTLTGEVFGGDGERAPGRVVQVIRLSDMAIHFSETDQNGEFRAENLEAGSWQVQALPGQQRLANMDGAEENALGDLIAEMKTAIAEVKEGETVHIVLGAPPADPIQIHGRITHHGESYGNAIIVFYSEGKEMMQKMRNATADAAGAFEVTLDGPGKYIVTVQKFGEALAQQSSIEFQVEIPHVEEHDLELAIPSGRITGFLRGVGGKEIAHERVNLYPAGPAPSGSFWGGHYVEVRSDEEGRFDIQGLRPGRYSVAAGGMPVGGMFGSAAKYGRAVREVEVGDDEWVQGVDFRLDQAANARVRVVDAAGKPVEGAAIFVRDEAGNLVELFSMTSTDNQGLCEYGGLTPARYTFSARKQGFASEETSLVAVDLGETIDVQLVLQEGTMLWVKLVNAAGEGVQASISVLDDEGRQVGTMVALSEIMELLGGEGFSMTERRIGPLPPGDYRVIATSKDGQEESKPVTLRRQSERRLTIHFRE